MPEKIWPAAVTSISAVFSALLAMWPGGMIRGGVDQPAAHPLWWFSAHMIAGALGIFALLYVHRAQGAARAALAVGAGVLATVLFTEPFHPLSLVTVVLPALGLTAGAIMLAPPPEPATY